MSENLLRETSGILRRSDGLRRHQQRPYKSRVSTYLQANRKSIIFMYKLYIVLCTPSVVQKFLKNRCTENRFSLMYEYKLKRLKSIKFHLRYNLRRFLTLGTNYPFQLKFFSCKTIELMFYNCSVCRVYEIQQCTISIGLNYS